MEPSRHSGASQTALEVKTEPEGEGLLYEAVMQLPKHINVEAAFEDGTSVPEEVMKEEPQCSDSEEELPAVKSELKEEFQANQTAVKQEPDINPDSFQTQDWSLPAPDQLTDSPTQEPDTYDCPTCGKTFKEIYYLTSHFQQHTYGLEIDTLQNKLYTCKVCKKAFENEGALTAHYAAHGSKSIPCGFCKRHFHSLGHLKQHESTHANKETSIACNICQKSFASVTDLYIHKHIHRETNEAYSSESGPPLFVCFLCNKRFCYESQLVNHKLRHAKKKLLSCQLCGKQFSNELTLKSHLQTHTSFVCEICSMIFKYKGLLDEHKKTHTDIACKICKKQFSHICSLNKHFVKCEKNEELVYKLKKQK